MTVGCAYNGVLAGFDWMVCASHYGAYTNKNVT